jgi:hypothetical protein
MLYRNLSYPDTDVLVILPKEELAEIPRSQPSFTTFKTEKFVRSVLRQFVRALKMMPKTINGQKQNGKAFHFPLRPSVWLIENIRFKLHLRPNAQSSGHVTNKIPPLPRGKLAINIFSDFLRYLHQYARTYIEETHAIGVELWHTLEDHTVFVLTHPNGWEGAQQSMMRTAAVKAGLIPDNEDGHSRLSFVTEGEATSALLYSKWSYKRCHQGGLYLILFLERISMTLLLHRGKGLLIVDAGGGTIDISAYRRKSPHSQSYEEIAAPECVYVFVILRFI